MFYLWEFIYKTLEIYVFIIIPFISGKKVPVGHFVIGPDVGGTYGEQWKQALAKPGQQITKWQAFE